mmetsp:Transcript_39121/g.92438  ORF Transcript_39121/g.92438 Transcript_39121/m.92438 type:complete len:241 (+) Transcript_39121:862-1584(+)
MDRQRQHRPRILRAAPFLRHPPPLHQERSKLPPLLHARLLHPLPHPLERSPVRPPRTLQHSMQARLVHVPSRSLPIREQLPVQHPASQPSQHTPKLLPEHSGPVNHLRPLRCQHAQRPFDRRQQRPSRERLHLPALPCVLPEQLHPLLCRLSVLARPPLHLKRFVPSIRHNQREALANRFWAQLRHVRVRCHCLALHVLDDVSWERGVDNSRSDCGKQLHLLLCPDEQLFLLLVLFELAP